MEFQDAVRRRRMVRRFTPEPVEPERVDRLLRNAVRAPNAGFAQGWSFLVLDTDTDIDRFWAATTPAADSGPRLGAWLDGMRTAPVLVVVLTSREVYERRYAEDDKRPADRWAVPFWHVDAGMAALLMLLTAVDEELGACFFGVGADEQDGLRAAFGVPASYEATGVVALGHPAQATPSGSPTRRPRKPIEDLVHRGRW